MQLSELKDYLSHQSHLNLYLPDGSRVPAHFHVTEVGRVDKVFIDCGGTRREEHTINLQLWNANDYDHRLHPEKLVDILSLAEEELGLSDLQIEVEYQGEATIQKYDLAASGRGLELTGQQTDCLARDACAIPVPIASSCTPGAGCC